MTKQDLAKLINVSRNTITNWEKEKPELMKLIKLGLQIENHFEENIPKEYIDKRLNNKHTLNEARKEEILKLFKITSLGKFKYTIIKWIKFEEIHTHALKNIEKANDKYTILYELKEMLNKYAIYESNREKNEYHYKYLITNINDELKFDFNTSDINIMSHIITRYQVYENLYNLDNGKEIKLEIINTLTSKKYNKYFIGEFIKIFVNKFGIETVEETLKHYKGIYEEELYQIGIEKIKSCKIHRDGSFL